MLPPQLAPLLDALDPRGSLPSRLNALDALAKLHFDVGRLKLARGELQIARLRALIDALAKEPAYRDRLRETIASILRDTTAVALFSEAGIPSDRGLGSETIDRIARRVLPQPPDDGNLERFVSRIFRSNRECAWIAEAPDDLFVALGELLGDIWAPLREAMSDAIALLSTRISALGLSVDLRERSDSMQVRDSPFFRIPHVPLEEMPMVIVECRQQLVRVHERLETTGVSVDTVYCMHAIRRMLLRIERMLPFVTNGVTPAAARTLLGALTTGRVADESLRQLGRQNLALLAKKVIERVGHTGEHYVTSSKREYFGMLGSAAGGGAVIGLTIVGKFLVRWSEFPPFLDGLFVSGVYAGTFILMQLLGFTLATKQPSMTAAALAATIHEGEQQQDDLVALIARIARSQFAAFIGNVAAVIPMVVLLDLLWIAAAGHHFFDEHAAHHALESIDPRTPSTLIFGAITGVLLWVSSLGGGWLENWVTYRRLPDALRARGLPRVAAFVTKHSAGIGGNVTLGLLFGMAPNLGAFFGVPLDSRHVTISSGMFVFAVCSQGASAITFHSCLGIALIGLLNFGVSFALALSVALRAKEAKSTRVGLALSVVRSFVRRPLRFFYPPLDRAQSEPVRH